MADLRNRAVRDILITCVAGLAGFAGAITATFTSTVVRRCPPDPEQPAPGGPP